MAYAPIDNTETTTVQLDAVRKFFAVVVTRINDYRTERKELKSLYHYHSEKSADMEQAKRDVNRVWQGHF